MKTPSANRNAHGKQRDNIFLFAYRAKVTPSHQPEVVTMTITTRKRIWLTMVLLLLSTKIHADVIDAMRKDAEQGDASAQVGLGFVYDTGLGVPENDWEAFKWYRLAAEQGHVTAQSRLGSMYDLGEGVPRDDREAAKWYHLAAEQGNATAQFNLGNMYDNGRGVPRDDREAVKWFRQAAEQGSVLAQLNLGVMYANGKGVPRDDREAVKWFRQAAEQRNALAQFNMGNMYNSGRGVPRDDREATKWFRLAAEQGYATAQSNLGFKYAEGEGVSRDYEEATRWYRLAAEQGNAAAQFNLGNVYVNGTGVSRDDREAVKWFRLAAEQGNATAQFNLGVMYANGEGAPRNLQEAYIWFSLAAAGGNNKNATIYQNRSEQDLSRVERSAAQREAIRRWKEISERRADKATLPLSSPILGNITQGVGGVLHFAGTIEAGSARRLEARIKAGDIRAVAFNSKAGELIEAMAIGRLIRNNLIRTEVPHYAKCYSACVIAFVGGVERSPDGSLGIHSFYTDEFIGTGNFIEASKVYDQVSRKLESYLKEMRIPITLLDHMKRISHKDMDILDAEKRREYFLEGIDPVYQQTHKP